MPQGKKENILDYIKRIGPKAYAQEATDIKIKSQRRRDFKKTGQYSFGLKNGGFAPNTKYEGSYISGDFDGTKVSNPSYKKYYKGLLK